MCPVIFRYTTTPTATEQKALADARPPRAPFARVSLFNCMNQYTAESIEVLTGLDPVRRRPGMYTDTTRPNHLVQEVVDNSIDEALAGFATEVDVEVALDGSIRVTDNGRGMPVDLHPEEGISGVELILTRLHAGGKFSGEQYHFSGGLHGVGVSVVNALSKWLQVEVKRDGKRYRMRFEHGAPVGALEEVGVVSRRDTGTSITFLPDARYFDSTKLAAGRLRHLLRAKAVLCTGLQVRYSAPGVATEQWHYSGGLSDYLAQALESIPVVPEQPLTGAFEGGNEALEWAIQWVTDGGAPLTESYANLIPTPLGGTHVNGLRAGLTDALREFCEFRNLLPRGVRLTGEDLFERLAFVLSVKLREPQFSGQTKERLASRECATFVAGAVKDAFSLWLNQHVQAGEAIAELAIQQAQKRLRAARQVVRKKVSQGPALPGKLADCTTQEVERGELFLVEGDSAGGSAKQARDREFQAVMPLRGKILNTWEVDGDQILASQEIHDIAVALGVDPGSEDLSGLRYGKLCILADADSDGLHIATLLCALFVRHFAALVRAGHVYVAMPPLFRIDVGKEIHYALDDSEREAILERLLAEGKKVKPNVQRFKGLGEMNPLQLRETTMAPDTRRLVQLTMDSEAETQNLLDLLLAKKRANDRRGWLEEKGALAEL